MRLVPGTDTVPNAVNKYLLPHEHQVITVRKHPAVLIGPIAISLAGLVIAAVISTTVARHNSGVVGFVWIAWAVVLLWLVFKVWEWSQDYFIVTSRRMLLATGVITRKVAMMPLVKVTDMSFQRSSLGRLLGYGEFILESAGLEQALRVVDHLPYPEQLYLEVCGLIFPGRKTTATIDRRAVPLSLPRGSCGRMNLLAHPAAGVRSKSVTDCAHMVTRTRPTPARIRPIR